MIPRIYATVVFVRDLAGCLTFYRDTLEIQMLDSDADGASFRLGEQYFLLLKVSAAADLLSVDVNTLKSEGAPRGLFAAAVENVDATYEALKAKGVTLLRPPTDQSWGLRTAHFADPEGNVWEINQPMVSKAVE